MHHRRLVAPVEKVWHRRSVRRRCHVAPHTLLIVPRRHGPEGPTAVGQNRPPRNPGARLTCLRVRRKCTAKAGRKRTDRTLRRVTATNDMPHSPVVEDRERQSVRVVRCADRTSVARPGAGDGNRTRITSLEGWGSTIELHPHAETVYRPAGAGAIATRHLDKLWLRRHHPTQWGRIGVGNADGVRISQRGGYAAPLSCSRSMAVAFRWAPRRRLAIARRGGQSRGPASIRTGRLGPPAHRGP